MIIKTFVNTIFNSNSFLIYQEKEKDVWVVDPGSNTSEIIDWMEMNNKSLFGILITHAHFDHILGLNQLTDKYPNSKVYASELASEGLTSAKVNGSVYLEIPFVYERKDFCAVGEGDKIKLWDEVEVNVLEAPGHNNDCVTFHVENNLFTGDALIPGVKVFVKFKKSNKSDAQKSISRLLNEYSEDTMVWPGHERNCLMSYFK